MSAKFNELETDLFARARHIYVVSVNDSEVLLIADTAELGK